MPIRPDSITLLAEGLLSCVCVALDARTALTSSYPGCPCRQFVSPGAPAWDCNDYTLCDGGPESCAGQLTVHFDGLSNQPPTGVGSRSASIVPPGCVHPAYASFIITLLRCAPMVHEDGSPPLVEDLDETASILHTDVEALQDAFACCLPGLVIPGIRTIKAAIEPVHVLDMQGGCVGISQRVSFALPICDCPTDPA